MPTMAVPSEATTVIEPLHVLLIEPDDDTRGLLELALSARGYVVISGDTAAAGIAAVDAEPFPVIVIGDSVPGFDIALLCRRLRAAPNSSESTIIVLSHRAGAVDREKLLAAGASDCLVWPADALLLRSYLEAAERLSTRTPDDTEGVAGDVDAAEATITLGRDGTIRSIGPQIERWLALQRGSTIGMSAFSLLHIDDAPELLALATQALRAAETTEPVTVRCRTGAGSWRRLRLRATSRLDDPELRSLVLLASPVDHAQPDPPDAGLWDGATGLAGISLFMDRLDHALQLAERRLEPVVAMTLEVDPAGDAAPDDVARAVADCVTANLRRGDTAARLSTLEFGLILEGAVSADEAAGIGQRILRGLVAASPGDSALLGLARVGIVVSWNGYGTAASVLDHAQHAAAAAACAQAADERFVVLELGRPPVDAVPPVRRTRPEPADSAPEDMSSPWFTPLMERIGALEIEIGRLNDRRLAAAKCAGR